MIFSREISMYTQITTIDTKLLIEKRQNILKQCHGNYTEVKKLYA